MRLSEHFVLDEFTKSGTAKRLGIDNTPTKNGIYKLTVIASHLETIREMYGGPLFITSGYRSPELNKAIGGSTRSAHCRCEAVDIDTGCREKNKQLFEIVRNYCEFDQLINEFDYSWIHIGFSKNMRGQILEAYSDKGTTKYKMS